MKIVKISEDKRSFEFYLKGLSESTGVPHYNYMPINIEWHKDDWLSKGLVFNDISFVLVDQNIAVYAFLGTIQITPDNVKKISYYGLSATSLYISKNHQKYDKHIRKIIKNEFNKIILITKSISYCNYLGGSDIDTIGMIILFNKGRIRSELISLINLEREADIIYSDVRKSYKSLINWGKNNIDISIFNAINITNCEIDEFRGLHKIESGRKTRTDENWMIQYKMVKNNEAFVIKGSIDGDTVAYGFFNYSKNVCNYGASVSRRDLFDKPIFHVILWESILYAKKLGCSYFELGEYLLPYSNKSKKELSISHFKSGFSTETKMQIKIES